ncbi:MAG: LysE family translocator [Sulfurospirillaceae bacterium]|nr:LysE family translocator [Sulfurospirillaceae bacterium]
MFASLPLASAAFAFFVIAVSPGPATISNATIAMNYGRSASLRYSSGLSLGLIFWGMIAASGMGVVLQGSLYVLMILKILGGLYLFWLAFSSARSARRKEAEDIRVLKDHRWFLRGLLLNMSNPKSVIAWMAALSIGINLHDDIYTLVITVAVCILVGFVTNAMYSVVFSIQGMMTWYRSFRRRIEAVTSGIFALAGFGLIRSAFTR